MTSSTNSDTTATAQPSHEVDILGFIEIQNIPTHHFGTPFTLTPTPGGEQSYKMLHETLDRTRKVGLVYIKIQSRKQLAVLVACGDALQLKALRCVGESSLFGDAAHAAACNEVDAGHGPHAMGAGWHAAGMTGDAEHFTLPGLRLQEAYASGADCAIDLRTSMEAHGAAPFSNRATAGRSAARRRRG